VWHHLERHEIRRFARGRAAAPPQSLPRPGLPAGTDLLPLIRHVVVLMMENHSYDNYFGMLQDRGEGFPLDRKGRPQSFNCAADGQAVRACHLSSTVQVEGLPSQSWHASHLQWAGGQCSGFVTSAEELQSQAVTGTAGDEVDTSAQATAMAMGYWDERDLPFYYGLARTFPVADHWFGSCLGPTLPNRRFLIAGTAHGLIDDSPYDLLDYPPGGTIFDLLSMHQISWANYHPVTDGQPRWRRYARHKRKRMRRRMMSLGRSFPSVTRRAQRDLQFTADAFPLRIGRYMQHVHSTDQFFADAADGTLPAVSFVDPDFHAYSEENPQDIRNGESFAAEVINAVLHGPGWPYTLLIWVYDEHGGYYDHVPPPPAIAPDEVEGHSAIGNDTPLARLLRPLFPRLVQGKENQDGHGPYRYDRYGFRVPAVIVSPFARPDYVCSQVLDHTSVLRLIEEKWNLPALTARDAAANTPLDALDFTSPPAFLKPPALPEPSLKWGSW
jgi:phospholipase C